MANPRGYKPVSGDRPPYAPGVIHFFSPCERAADALMEKLGCEPGPGRPG